MAKVRVSIGVEEKVAYHRYVEMDQSEYERLLGELDSGFFRTQQRAREAVRCMIDPRADFQDADDLEVTVFELARPPSTRSKE